MLPGASEQARSDSDKPRILNNNDNNNNNNNNNNNHYDTRFRMITTIMDLGAAAGRVGAGKTKDIIMMIKI